MKKYSPTPVSIRTSQLRARLSEYLKLVKYEDVILEVLDLDGRSVRAYIVPRERYEEWLLLEWEKDNQESEDTASRRG
ncbi:MAG: hypothetical protein ABIG63_09915 [Chloroflexota bacterium]